jgi:transcriptional regulator with XRE-family HTH domain
VLKAGQRLRAYREELGLTIRDVETASLRIADRHRNEDFALSLSRLSDIESKGLLPSVYRLYSLAVIYRLDLRELLSWYGVDINDAAADLALAAPPRSHKVESLDSNLAVRMPVKLDPSFDPRRTCNLGRLIERWGVVPVAFLTQFASTKYTYGYIGDDDFTMYPLLLPGSFVQIDERKNEVGDGMWRSEYERPIYFVETREGYRCCWCALKGEQIVLQPHPLSPVAVRVLRHGRDAEVIGQVVGVAMRLGEWRPASSSSSSKELPARS